MREGADPENHVWRNATLEYAPPEMLSHEGESIVHARLSQKVDVYELCSVLYELYCGQTPFQLASRKVGSTFRFKSYFEPTPLTPRSSQEEDKDLVHVLLAGLQADPDARPTIEGLLGQLEQIMA